MRRIAVSSALLMLLVSGSVSLAGPAAEAAPARTSASTAHGAADGSGPAVWKRYDVKIERGSWQGVGTLSLDGLSLTALVDGAPVPLTLHGFRVLEHLVTADRVVPAEELMVRAWGPGHARSRSTLRAVIHHVRESLPGPWAECLTTVRLRGYRWIVEG